MKSEDLVLAILVIGFFVWSIAYFVVMPLVNAYLQYRIQSKEMDMANEPIDWGKVEQERLQRSHDESDSPTQIGESDRELPIHDEKLPL